MRKVFSTRDLLAMTELRGLLDQEGIETTILRENTASLFSGLLPTEVPELWVVRDEDEDRARQLIEAFQGGAQQPPPGQSWICPTCGEQIEGQFTECWNCAAGETEST